MFWLFVVLQTIRRRWIPYQDGQYYLSTGNPVLVTNVGDMELYIKDGVNGYISKADDVKMFRDKLEYIAIHYNEAKTVGEKGKELVFLLFNYKVQTAKVLET